MKNLIALLIYEKGRIVSSASLETHDIDQAKAGHRWYVDENGFGFAWLPDFDICSTVEGVKKFEEWYPLPLQKPPKELCNPSTLWDEIKRRKEEEAKARLN